MATYTKRYVQYNDLPFDNYEMLRSWDDTVISFKQESSSYTFKHGSYVAFKSESMLVDKGNVSMTILLEMQRLPCNKRTYYRKYVLNEFSKPGKLWAVQNGELVWAWAYPDNVSEATSVSVANAILLDIDLVLYEGVWHKANAFTTFLEPYDLCDELEYKPATSQCEEYNKKTTTCETVIRHTDCGDVEEVVCNSCCKDCAPKLESTDGWCGWKEETKEEPCPCGCHTHTVVVSRTCECQGSIGNKPTMWEDTCDCDCGKKDSWKSICEVDLMSIFYSASGCSTTGYKIVEDCSYWKKQNGEDSYGTKIRGQACSNWLSGKVYANTDVDTTDYEIVITGVFHNAYVSVNGNGNVIEGDYEGSLKLRGDGTVWLLADECGWQELPVSVIQIPSGMELGFTFSPGWNRFTVDTGVCDCNTTPTAYITIDNITY